MNEVHFHRTLMFDACHMAHIVSSPSFQRAEFGSGTWYRLDGRLHSWNASDERSGWRGARQMSCRCHMSTFSPSQPCQQTWSSSEESRSELFLRSHWFSFSGDWQLQSHCVLGAANPVVRGTRTQSMVIFIVFNLILLKMRVLLNVVKSVLICSAFVTHANVEHTWHMEACFQHLSQGRWGFQMKSETSFEKVK